MVAIIDYGVGNLFSLSSSLKAVGAKAVITGDPEIIKKADRLDRVIKEQALSGKPLLGICLGMQLLFEKSYEFGEHEGLGLIKGKIVPFKGRIDESLKIPHIGWNGLNIKKESPILKDVKEGECVYFVHSFFADECEESVIATAEYGIEVTAAAANGNVYGCQFHPEKSGKVGMKILRAFCCLEEKL